MYDNFKLLNYSNSLVSPELYARHLSRLVTGNVLDGLNVVPKTGLTVTLQPGNGLIPYGSGATSSARIFSLVADFDIALDTADAGNPRIDLIVVYVDMGVSLPGGTPTAANLDGPGVVKATFVKGTPNANPVDPTVGAIQTKIGASNPYIVVGSVRVDALVGTIAANKITDRRTFVVTSKGLALGQGSFVESGGVPSFTVSTLNGAITAGVAWISVGGALIPQPFNSLSVTMAASKDRYYYVTLGNSTIQAAADVSNNAAPPTLPANSVLVAVFVSGASAITSTSDGSRSKQGYLFTDQALTSGSYADLATVGPSVTVNVPPSGKVKVSVHCGIYGATLATRMASFALTGANTVAAADQSAARNDNSTAGIFSNTELLTGLTPGLTTFTMRYKSVSAGNFFSRKIIVEPVVA